MTKNENGQRMSDADFDKARIRRRRKRFTITHEELDAAVQEYLAEGGKITKLVVDADAEPSKWNFAMDTGNSSNSGVNGHLSEFYEVYG